MGGRRQICVENLTSSLDTRDSTELINAMQKDPEIMPFVDCAIGVIQNAFTFS